MAISVSFRPPRTQVQALPPRRTVGATRVVELVFFRVLELKLRHDQHLISFTHKVWWSRSRRVFLPA